MTKQLRPSHHILAALVVGCFFIFSCENDMHTVQNLNKKSISVEEGKQIESYLSQDGKVDRKSVV